MEANLDDTKVAELGRDHARKRLSFEPDDAHRAKVARPTIQYFQQYNFDERGASIDECSAAFSMRRCASSGYQKLLRLTSVYLTCEHLLSLRRYLWQDKRGNYHALHHWQEGTHNKLLNGGHSFPRDGVSTASQCLKTAAEASLNI